MNELRTVKADVVKTRQATHETLTQVECNIAQLESTMMNEMSTVKADADKMREATRQVLCELGDEIREMQAHMAERESQVEARADRLIEMENQLSSLRNELSVVKTVPAVDKVSLAHADTECMMYDDNTASRDLGVQAPRNRTPSRSGMPRSAL